MTLEEGLTSVRGLTAKLTVALLKLKWKIKV